MQTAHIIDLIASIRDRAQAEIGQGLSDRGLEGLAPSHGVLLSRLFEEDGQTMFQLAERVGRDKSTVTVLVKKLVGLGYVTTGRDSKDQRITRVTLTDAGRALRPDLEALNHAMASQVFQGFNWNDRTQLIQLLERVLANL